MTDTDQKPPPRPAPEPTTAPEPAAAVEPIRTRRPYKRPHLTRYGTLAEVTQAVGNMGDTLDGGTPPTHKTA